MKIETTKNNKTSIEVTEVEEFQGDMKTSLRTSLDVAETVSALFGSIFNDFYGCNVRVNNGNNVNTHPNVVHFVPAGMIYVDLYFKERAGDGDGINALIRRNAKPDNESKPAEGGVSFSSYNRVNSQNNLTNTGRMYTVSKDAYDILDEFSFNTRNTRWTDLTQELSSSMGIIGSKEEAVVRICGLDLNKILTKIYGGTTDDGEFEYAVTPSTVIPYRTDEFIMQICQLNKNVVSRLQCELGIGSPAAPQFHVYNR